MPTATEDEFYTADELRKAAVALEETLEFVIEFKGRADPVAQAMHHLYNAALRYERLLTDEPPKPT